MRNVIMTSLSLILFTPAALMAGDLTINVSDIRNSDGALLLALHNKAKGFPGEDAAFAVQAKAADATGLTFSFANLPAGEYAVALFHDEDGNGKLDTNMVGVPLEGFGFSNNAMGQFGPPSFRKARFTMPDGDHAISINVAY